MKLHLPISLLTAVLATIIALPAQAVEAPEGYTTIYLNSPDALENYSTLADEDYMAFIPESSLEFSPTNCTYWTSSTPLISGGNIFFGSSNSNSPVALSFKAGGNRAAFAGQNELTFDTFSNLTFSTITGNKAAINIANSGTLAITNVNDGQTDTVDVLFKDIKNTSTTTFSTGSAISAFGSLSISNNGDVSFSGNSIRAYYYSNGGAIYAVSGLTISNNGVVSFSGNSASSTSYDYNSYGGAIFANSGLSISNNGDVSFSGNSASSHYYSYGGAIYANSGLSIRQNGDVSFSGNSNRAYYYSDGGAIYSSYGDVTISNNGDVSFSGNSSSSNFRSAYGGAIYVHNNLSIQGNDSVLFEKNYEQTGNTYRLRGIYGEENMTLSAKTGGYITFHDSVYIDGYSFFNSDYTDAEGNIQSAGGDIIFSGKYAEQHLNEILTANNEGRTATAEEILNAQTSTIGGNAYLNGGSLQIKDGAVFNVNGDTVSIADGSNAKLAISDAELAAANATIEVGESATLQLSNGAAVTADEINIAAGATLSLGDVATTTATSDAMVAAYRLSSLNVINADLTFAAGSTLVTDGTGTAMSEGNILTFNATSEGEKINLVFTLGTEYGEEGLVQLFSNVDIVKFLMDGEEVDGSITLLASDFFTGDYINENTTLTYDSSTKEVYLQGVSKVVPEPTTATLSLLALAALAMRRRRK